jgi:hypothetical protein
LLKKPDNVYSLKANCVSVRECGTCEKCKGSSFHALNKSKSFKHRLETLCGAIEGGIIRLGRNRVPPVLEREAPHHTAD